MKFIKGLANFFSGMGSYVMDSIHPKKIKSSIYTDITAWEYELMYESICKDNRIICTNCESHFLKGLPDQYINSSIYYFCEICGQLYLFRKPKNSTRFNRFSVENYGIAPELINLDIVRYKKLSKIKSKI